MTAVLRTSDGWRVEAVLLDGAPCYLVTCRGYAMGSATPKKAGQARDLAAVRSIMGDSFAHLQEAAS